MCVLLLCSSVSLVIAALKPNSLPYVKFSNTFSNLVVHSTDFHGMLSVLFWVCHCIFGVSFVCLMEK